MLLDFKNRLSYSLLFVVFLSLSLAPVSGSFPTCHSSVEYLPFETEYPSVLNASIYKDFILFLFASLPSFFQRRLEAGVLKVARSTLFPSPHQAKCSFLLLSFLLYALLNCVQQTAEWYSYSFIFIHPKGTVFLSTVWATVLNEKKDTKEQNCQFCE